MNTHLKLNSSLTIPSLGFGTWKLKGDDCLQTVTSALEIGYRHIDTADAYGNHKEVGNGIKESSIKRENLFLTTKVWRDSLHTQEVQSAVKRFLEELQTDYLDLLLIHWPNTDVSIEETLSAMQILQKEKVIRSIGISNFTIPLLQKALETEIPFSNLQIEFHPSLNQKELKAFCDENDIIVTAYSPIAQGADLTLPLIQHLAEKYAKTPSQIILNWIVRKNMVVIPRSSNKERIKENFDIYSFELSDEESEQIDTLDLHNRIVHPEFAPFTD